jgi:galactitol-specific phosphotransferase system IIC component
MPTIFLITSLARAVFAKKDRNKMIFIGYYSAIVRGHPRDIKEAILLLFPVNSSVFVVQLLLFDN